MARKPRPSEEARGIEGAFDEVRFGAARTLNLRASFPTGDEAAQRLERWLRERQAVSPKEEVLVITGRGRGSEGGISIVRESVVRRLSSLRRRGVVREIREHNPGSFVVTLAPLSALLEAPRRRKEAPPPRPDPRALAALEPGTRDALRVLAERALDVLGVPDRPKAFVEDEMVRQFERLAPSAGKGPDREQRLLDVIRAATDELDDA
jgi:hypothetical protein